MVEFTITSPKLPFLIERLAALSKQLKDGPGLEVMKEVGRQGMADIDARFDTGGYGTWVPLSPITIAKKGGRTEILIDTQNMRRSVGIANVTPHSVSVTVPYGGRSFDSKIPKKHQFGMPERNLPQRKIVEKTPRLLELLSATYTRMGERMV